MQVTNVLLSGLILVTLVACDQQQAATDAQAMTTRAPQSALEQQFCRGFAKGFVDGWNSNVYVMPSGYVAGQLIAQPVRHESPTVPACQIELTDNDPNSTMSSFDQGVQKGIQRGAKAYGDDLGSGSQTDLARKAAAEAFAATKHERYLKARAAYEQRAKRCREIAQESTSGNLSHIEEYDRLCGEDYGHAFEDEKSFQ